MNDLKESAIFIVLKYTFEGRARELKTPGSITNPKNNKKKTGLLLWDTGATISCINSKYAPDLGLEVKGVIPLHTGNGVVNAYRYISGIILENEQKKESIHFDNRWVTSVNLSENILGIIGMDIISKGSFLLHYNENVNQHILQFSWVGLKCFDNFSFEKEKNKQDKRVLKSVLKALGFDDSDS